MNLINGKGTVHVVMLSCPSRLFSPRLALPCCILFLLCNLFPCVHVIFYFLSFFFLLSCPVMSYTLLSKWISLFCFRIEEPVPTPERQAGTPPLTSTAVEVVSPNVSKAVTPRVVFTGLNPGAVRRLAEVSLITVSLKNIVRTVCSQLLLLVWNKLLSLCRLTEVSSSYCCC